MSDKLTKSDLPFLVAAMDARDASAGEGATALAMATAVATADDQVKGPMSVPQPVTVNVNGDMSDADYKACSMVMAVCQNMVQKTLTDAAKTAGMQPADALKNMNAWIKAYVDFPFPFFNFVDSQSQTLNKDEFSLKADPDVVAEVVNIRNVANLQAAVVDALKKSGGEVARYKSEEKDFNYFGVITGFAQTGISVRLVKFQLHTKTVDVKALCVTYQKTTLDSAYDTYMFTADKELMIKMQEKIGDQLVDYFADKLLAFIKEFYDHQLQAYKAGLADILKQGA